MVKRTYNVLIFLGVVGDLGDADGAGDILTVLGLTYCTVLATGYSRDLGRLSTNLSTLATA